MSIESFEAAFRPFDQHFKADFRGAVDYATQRLRANQRGQGATFLEDNQHAFHQVWCAFDRDVLALAAAYRGGDADERAGLRALLDQFRPVAVGLQHVVEWRLPLLHQKLMPLGEVQPLFDLFALLEDRGNPMRVIGTLSALCKVVAELGGDPRQYLAAAAAIAAPDTAAKLAAFKPVDTAVWPS